MIVPLLSLFPFFPLSISLPFFALFSFPFFLSTVHIMLENNENVQCIFRWNFTKLSVYPLPLLVF